MQTWASDYADQRHWPNWHLKFKYKELHKASGMWWLCRCLEALRVWKVQWAPTNPPPPNLSSPPHPWEALLPSFFLSYTVSHSTIRPLFGFEKHWNQHAPYGPHFVIWFSAWCFITRPPAISMRTKLLKPYWSRTTLLTSNWGKKTRKRKGHDVLYSCSY